VLQPIAMLEFRILGPLEVLSEGLPLALGGQKQRALLARLLTCPREVVSTDRLIDDLWGEAPPRTAATSLQNFVSQLRKALGAGVLATKSPGYALMVDGEQIDSVRFERAVADARGGMPTERAERIAAALSLWRGAALSDFTFDPWAENESRRLDELRLTAIEERIDAELELGRDRELVPELEALVAANSMRERLRGQLMLALYRSGRQAEALTAYQQARRELVEGLGIEPGPELQRLHASILRQEAPLEAHPAEDLTDDHYDDVVRALHDGRLVVVLGFGVNLADRPSDATWSAHDPRFPPTADDAAVFLAHRFDVPRDRSRDLAQVSQYVALTKGVGPLYDELHGVFDHDYPPGPVHTVAVELAAAARASGAPYPLLVTSHYDQTLERAFAEAGEQVDVVCYVAAGRDRGKFLHFAPSGEPTVVEIPNSYAELTLADRPAILKLHGQVDRRPERDHESFVVSEDDYIGYLAQAEIANVVPVTLAAKLRRSHFLFLGYALDEWHLRVFLHRVWGDQQAAYRSWAIQPNPGAMTKQYWRHRNVDIFDLPLGEYVAGVRARLGAVEAVA
jgi:DNA-binding SARP family transcriptional activator